MPSTDPRIDAYIAAAPEFARPILQRIRKLVHKACPEVEETMKWSFPHFDYRGILCSMAAFKQHCAFGFWKASLMNDSGKLLNPLGNTSMGNFDRITSLKDLPRDKVLLSYIREAVKLNEEGIKLPPKEKVSGKKPLALPDDLARALQKNKKALAAFEKFSPSHKKEYIEWIVDAKTEATRIKRLETAVEWIAEGKSRHWKYQR